MFYDLRFSYGPYLLKEREAVEILLNVPNKYSFFFRNT